MNTDTAIMLLLADLQAQIVALRQEVQQRDADASANAPVGGR